MSQLEKDLAQNETSLGFIPGDVLKFWSNKQPELEDNYQKLITEPTKWRGQYCPAGYIGPPQGATPVKKQMIALIVAFSKYHFENRYSYQEIADLLLQEGIKLTRIGVKKRINWIGDKLGLSEHIPKGRKVTVESLEDAERLVKQERKRYAKEAKRTGKTPDEVREDMEKLQTTGKSRLKDPPKKKSVESTEEVQNPDSEFSGREVIYEPTPKQQQFHAASERFVLYGGSAGGGKSFALIFDAIRYAHVPGYKALIIRRTIPELTELIDTTKEYYPKLFPGAKFNGTDKVWRFPSGAQLFFGYLEKPGDKYRYQGQQYHYIAFDELGQWSTPEGWDYLASRNRNPPTDPTTGEKIPLAMRATSNPGASWVKERFIDPAEPGTPFYNKAGLPIKFIPASLLDNPHLDEDYRLMLESLPDVEKRQLLYGDWNATDLAAFPEFRKEGMLETGPDGNQQYVVNPHVVEPFFIPKHWNRVCGMDYGYRDPATAVWYAINPKNGQKIVYKEYQEAGRTGKEFGKDVIKMEHDEVIPIDHVLDWSVFNKTGHTGPTVGEEIRMTGLVVRPADKNRVGGKVQIHEHLRPLPGTKDPGLIIFNTCQGVIKQLEAAQIKEKDPDDIDQTRIGEGGYKHHWDLYDSLRYALMARPTRQNRTEQLRKVKQESRWKQVNRYFS